METRRLKVGLLGAGRIGKVHGNHVARFIPEAELVWVVDVDEAAARALAAQCGVAKVGTDPGAVLADPEVDAVLICTSTDTHARLIEEAAAAGKHIFCEKPIAHDLESIDRALAAVEKAGVALQIGFNRRFDANFSRVRRAIASGEIAAPRLMHIVSRDPGPPPIEYVRRSGGIFFDMTIHDFDMARYLMGCEVEEVFAYGAVRVDPAIGEAGDLDTALIVLKFANGAIGTIDNCREAVYGYDQRVEVLGSNGAISVENNYPNTATISNGKTIHRDLPLNFFMDRYTESFRVELESFVRAVLSGTPPEVTGHDGRMAVVVGMAAKQSVAEGKSVKIDSGF
ncbi:MAG: inositol 2-dehydrogenase [Verrucomicrobiales bacterium]|nr:inositol 2-dehydrogenase [Verrucomicrobiales bacterium]